MVSLKEFMEIVNYRITEGSDYQWVCYGPTAYSLDSWNGDQNGHSLTIIFDTDTQEVYEVQAHDYLHQRAYRLINPDYKFGHDDEAAGRDVDNREAWDDVFYVDLESDDDFIQKALAIVAGEDYDTRVDVPVDLPEDVLFTLMKQAHELDITLNQHMENVLKEAIARVKSQYPEIQSSPFPADNFTQEEAHNAVKKAKKKKRG